MTFEEYLAAGRKAGEADLALVEKELATMYRDSYREAARELEKFMAKGFTPEEVRKYGRLQGLLDGIAKEYKKLTGKALDVAITSSSDSYLEAFKHYEFALDASEGLSVGWGMPPVDAIRASVFSDHSGLTIEQIFGKNYTAEWSRIQGTITRGIIQGKGYVKTARELKDDFAGNLYNAVRVVRTEGTRNWTEGSLAAHDRAVAMGIEVDKVWIAAMDRRTRPDHGALDGQIADKDGFFHMSGVKYQGPGLSDGGPETVINCRCALSDILRGVPPEVRRIHGEGVQPYSTYADWASVQGWSPDTGWPKLKKV